MGNYNTHRLEDGHMGMAYPLQQNLAAGRQRRDRRVPESGTGIMTPATVVTLLCPKLPIYVPRRVAV
jgi:hypothetical protein